jgi:hypothetical protein
MSGKVPIKALLRGKKLKKGESSKKKIKIEKTSLIEVGVVAQAGPKNTCGVVFKSGTHTAAKRLFNLIHQGWGASETIFMTRNQLGAKKLQRPIICNLRPK